MMIQESVGALVYIRFFIKQQEAKQSLNNE